MELTIFEKYYQIHSNISTVLSSMGSTGSNNDSLNGHKEQRFWEYTLQYKIYWIHFVCGTYLTRNKLTMSKMQCKLIYSWQSLLILDVHGKLFKRTQESWLSHDPMTNIYTYDIQRWMPFWFSLTFISTHSRKHNLERQGILTYWNVFVV